MLDKVCEICCKKKSCKLYKYNYLHSDSVEDKKYCDLLEDIKHQFHFLEKNVKHTESVNDGLMRQIAFIECSKK